MGKAVCIVSENPDIKVYCDRMDELTKEFQQKMMFIRKQKENAEGSYRKDMEKEFNDIEKILLTKGKLPSDYCSDKYTLGFNPKKDIIEIENRKVKEDFEASLPIPIKALIQALKNGEFQGLNSD